MCNVRLDDRISPVDLRNILKLNSLVWTGPLEKIEKKVWSSNCRTSKVRGSFPTRRHTKTWNEIISSDLKEKEVSKDQSMQVWKIGVKTNMMMNFLLSKQS